MATGGTGDVLAGLLGALLAGGMRPREAARVGAWVHGRAGELAAAAGSVRGSSLEDVVVCLREAWRLDDPAPMAPVLTQLPAAGRAR